MIRSVLVLVLTIAFLSLAACQPAAAPTAAPTVAPTIASAAPTAAPTAAPAGPLIADLVVLDDATKSSWSIATNLQAGDQQFGDRSYYIAKLPDVYAGSDWIRTAADAKKVVGASLATFKVTAEADVYVAHDDRILTKPTWLRDWKDTGDDILNTETTPTTLSIYTKRFPANSTVTIGENGGSAGALGLMVFVRRPGQKPVVAPSQPGAVAQTCKWDACLGMRADWYGLPEAVRVADNLLLYQHNTGGWYKGIDMAAALDDVAKAKLQAEKSNTTDSTIDNNATTSQIIYLGRVYNATKQDRFKDAFIKGLDYLFQAQYPNGGWPQYYPVDPSLYYARITYNDNAMVNVMTLLRDISKDPSYAFVDADRRAKADKAVQKGIEVTLQAQIVINGKKTAWCAQHDEKTLAPALARSYELPSISGQESVGIVRFLMTIEKPSPQVVDAIQSAVKWMDDAKILGVQVMDKPDATLPGGFDRVAVANPNAPPIWGRFYDLETGKAFFVGRDGVKKNTLAEIEHERRVGYSYYTNAPAFLLANDYPSWQTKNGVPSVLSKPIAAPANPTAPAAAPPSSASAPTVTGSTAPQLAAKKQTSEAFSESFENGAVGEFPADWVILDKDNHTTNKSGPRVANDAPAADGKLAIRVTSNPTVDGQMTRDFSPLQQGRLIYYGMVPGVDPGFTSVELRDGGTRLFNLEMHPEGRLRYRDENGNLNETNVKYDFGKWYQFIMEWDSVSSIWNGYVVIDGKPTRLTPENGVPFPAASKGKSPNRIQLRLNRAGDGPKVGYVDGFKVFKLE